MWQDNVVGKISPDLTIFRILDYKYVLNSFENDTSYFRWPQKWPDPYDSIFLKMPCKSDTGDTFMHGSYDQIYCQCWCKKESESDAMWRLYSTEKQVPEIGLNSEFQGLMIVSTVENVMTSIWDNADPLSQFRYLCGEVDYIDQNQFYDPSFFDKNVGGYFDMHNSSENRTLLRTILYKTRSYDHENEVRFIKWSESHRGEDGIFVNHKPSFRKIISKIVVDPRSKKEFFEFIQKQVFAIDPSILVTQSDLLTRKPMYYTLSGEKEMMAPYRPNKKPTH